MPKNHDGRELCHFTYADGRRCTLPQFPDDMGPCYHHGDQYRASLQSKEAGRQVSGFSPPTSSPPATSVAPSPLFSPPLRRAICNPKSLPVSATSPNSCCRPKNSKQEYLEAFNDPWPKVVAEGAAFNDPEPEPDEPQSEPQPLSPTRPLPYPPANNSLRQSSFRMLLHPPVQARSILKLPTRTIPLPMRARPFAPAGILRCRWPTSALRLRLPFHLDSCGAEKEAPL